MVTKKQVGVIYGGISGEHETNRSSIPAVVSALKENDYEVKLVKLCKDGSWRWSDTAIEEDVDAVSTSQLESVHLGERHGLSNVIEYLQNRVDICFLNIPGRYSEDGRLQSVLDFIDMPYTFSGVLSSAVGMHKPSTYRLVEDMDVSIPRYEVMSEPPRLASGTFPLIAKPTNEGASIAVDIIENQVSLKKYFQNHKGDVLLQEYVEGDELTAGVLYDDEPVALPPTKFVFESRVLSESVKDEHRFTYQTPADVPTDITKRVQSLAVQIHERVVCNGASRSDFIKKGDDLYFLEINTIPGITEKSALPEAARTAGYDYEDMINCIMQDLYVSGNA